MYVSHSYGLLGPGCCGKTTLLHCIVGSLKVDRGAVMTLGARPGQPGHKVPGCRVGYIPQELALYQSGDIVLLRSHPQDEVGQDQESTRVSAELSAFAAGRETGDGVQVG